MSKPAYGNARWLYYVADRDSGEVLLSQRPDEMVLTASTGKEFTIGTVYDTIGADTRLTTPVYATAPPVNGVLRGDVILVASGDLAMGGRGAMHGRVDDAFDATSIDHVYGDLAPNARKVNDDPLAGLDDLARQVAAKGVKTVDGDDGLKTIRTVVKKAGLDSDAVVLTDGEGAYPASSTPKQMTDWIKWAASQPWGQAFVAGQPVLGETGTIAAVGVDSPAKGKVQAKTGSVAAADPVTGRALFNVQSLAGYMTTDKGRHLIFDLSMSGATYPDVPTGLREANDDVGMVAAEIQQSLSK